MTNFQKVLAFTLLGATPTFADVIAVNGDWYGFCFSGAGNGITRGCRNAGVGSTGNPVEFTLNSTGTFRITDAGWAGDSFDVYVNNVLTLQTPTVVPNDQISEVDPDISFANPAFSSGIISLGPGSYSLRILLRDAPFEGGGAYLSVVSHAVPEPTEAAAMGLLAATGLSVMVRRRRRE
ncbi:hypothetical protein F183_A43070 [Bryobacterales bacterium F-183]|nr:hypothetical protein F183_A43070 [Bryobacterales bacterium F-183]